MVRRHRTLAAWLSATAMVAAFVLAACTTERTHIMLVVAPISPCPRTPTRSIRVVGTSGRERVATARLDTTRPVTLALPADGEAGGNVSMVVSVQREGAPVAGRAATTSFAEGDVKQLDVCVARACATDCAPLDALRDEQLFAIMERFDLPEPIATLEDASDEALASFAAMVAAAVPRSAQVA